MGQVHVIGASNFDLRVLCKSKVCINSSLPSTINYCAGGVGRNIAYNLAIMQVNTTLTSIIPSNIFGQFILDETNIDNLETRNMLRTNSSTSFYCDVFDGFDNYKFNDMCIIDELEICHLPDTLPSASLIVLDLNISEQLLDYIIHNNSAPIICDATSIAKCAKITPHLPYISTLKCNYDEAQRLASIIKSDSSINGINNIAEVILDAGVGTIYITLGKDGAFLADSDAKYELRIKNTRVVSAVGAGDAFTAAIAYGMFSRFCNVRILDYAVKTSSVLALHEANVLDREMLNITQHLENDGFILLQL